MQIMLEKLQVVSKPTHYDHHGHPLAAAASLRTQDPDHHISPVHAPLEFYNKLIVVQQIHHSNSCKSEAWQEALAHLQHTLHIHTGLQIQPICTCILFLNLEQSFDFNLFMAQMVHTVSVQIYEVRTNLCDRINTGL
jgi:hypothetical protein